MHKMHGIAQNLKVTIQLSAQPPSSENLVYTVQANQHRPSRMRDVNENNAKPLQTHIVVLQFKVATHMQKLLVLYKK